MLTAPVIMILLAVLPQDGRLISAGEDLNKWKPGPRVAGEIARLERDGRQIFRSFRDGKIAQLTLIRELARVKTTMEALRTWSFTNHSDEVPNLVVVIDSDEYWQVFPRGLKHLPSSFVTGEVYPATPGGTTLWQYLGEKRVSGMRLSVFRNASSEVEVQIQPRG